MFWFLIGLGLVFLFAVGGRAFVNASPGRLARIAAVGGSMAAAILGVFLTMRGLGAAGVPLLMLGLGGFGAGLRGGGRRRSTGRASRVETATVRMELDHDTGAMDGEVLRGPFAGRRLSQLARDEVEALWSEAQSEDPDGAAVLEAYLSHRFGARAEGRGGDRSGARGSTGSGGVMSEAEALDILGLESGAGANEIQAAYKRLMAKLHPDRGGTDWLAAKLNQAKDLLLAGARRS